MGSLLQWSKFPPLQGTNMTIHMLPRARKAFSRGSKTNCSEAPADKSFVLTCHPSYPIRFGQSDLSRSPAGDVISTFNPPKSPPYPPISTFSVARLGNLSKKSWAYFEQQRSIAEKGQKAGQRQQKGSAPWHLLCSFKWKHKLINIKKKSYLLFSSVISYFLLFISFFEFTNLDTNTFFFFSR